MISEKFPRFCALDRARGLAMILMVMAHFGPGVYERLGIGGIALDILNVLGRMATPSFIMVFGITLAFVHIRKAQANEPGLRRSLTKRAGMVFAFSLLVSLPQSLDHVFNTQAAGLGEWRELSDLHLHYNGPPQYWYMTMVAGVLLLSLLALDRFTVPMPGKILGIVGRSPLHFYVAHAFVLPAVGLIRFLTPGVSDTAAIGLSMGAFVVYCGLKISREYRTGPLGRHPLVGVNP